MLGLGQLMIYQIKNHKVKNFVLNLHQNKTFKSLKLISKGLANKTRKY